MTGQTILLHRNFILRYNNQPFWLTVLRRNGPTDRQLSDSLTSRCSLWLHALSRDGRYSTWEGEAATSAQLPRRSDTLFALLALERGSAGATLALRTALCWWVEVVLLYPSLAFFADLPPDLADAAGLKPPAPDSRVPTSFRPGGGTNLWGSFLDNGGPPGPTGPGAVTDG